MASKTALDLTALQKQSLSFWLHGLNANHPSSSNQPSLALPFQRWFKFKEAFSPSLVIDCINSLDYKPESCLDVFGGCGTSGLTCQFLGIEPTLIELNPFIADLAEAKLHRYDYHEVIESFSRIKETINSSRIRRPMKYLGEAPQSFCESPGRDRWLFTSPTLARIIAYRDSIAELPNANVRRLFRVLLGSCLVPLSNVIVNGKGRKYRNGWNQNQKDPDDVDVMFESAFNNALADIRIFANRATDQYTIHRGSALDLVSTVNPVDVAIFSPPYPNSFDYTDIYNIELWVLGYLQTRAQDRALRTATIRSHVQVELDKRYDPAESKQLLRLLKKLKKTQESLWDSRLPQMIAGYFSDLAMLLSNVKEKVRPKGEIFIVVGDSSYNGIVISVASILEEIAEAQGFRVLASSVIRKMRKSAQQGGNYLLDERILRIRVP